MKQSVPENTGKDDRGEGNKKGSFPTSLSVLCPPQSGSAGLSWTVLLLLLLPPGDSALALPAVPCWVTRGSSGLRVCRARQGREPGPGEAVPVNRVGGVKES